ncbi:MAG: plasmid stabilization protein [Acinetobacter sp.]
MANLTIRNVPDEIHRALKIRAAKNGCSTEAEIRHILENVVKPTQQLGLGDQLAFLASEQGLSNHDIEILEQNRNTTPAEPVGLI